MTSIHFSIPQVSPPDYAFELAAIQGTAAALVAAIEKGSIHPTDNEKIKTFIKLVKAELFTANETE